MATSSSTTNNGSLSVSSELMPNQVAGRVLPKQRAVSIAFSTARSPMLFAVDAVGKLTLTLPAADSLTGWSQIDLTAQLAAISGVVAGSIVQTFTTSQDADGGIWLVLAVGPSLSSASQILLSSRLTNAGLASDWANLATHLVLRPVPPSTVVSSFLLGRDDDGLGPPLIVATGGQNQGDATHYMINPDTQDDSWTYSPLQLPQNATSVIDAAVGSIEDLGRGVYTLSAIADTRTLTFTTLPTMFNGLPVTESRQLDLPTNFVPLTLTSIAVDKGHTELYIGGSGVCRFSRALQSPDSTLKAVQIATAETVKGVRELVVTTDAVASTIDVWALDQADQLVHFSGSRNSTDYTWLSPLLLQSEVAAVAAYRAADDGSTIDVSGLLLGKTGGDLALLTQESSTSLWQSNTISLLQEDEFLTMNTYTTQITLRDQDGVAWAGQEVQITPSHDCAAMVNGQYMSLKQSAAKTAITDNEGIVCIVLETADLSAPVFKLVSNGLHSTSNPTHQLTKTLQGGNGKGITANEILKAQRSDDKPLFPNGADQNKCKTAAELVAKLVDVQKDLAADGSVHPDSVKPHMMNASPHRHTVKAMGVSFADETPRILSHQEALAVHAAVADTDRLWVTAGDLFMAVGRALKKVKSILINKLRKGWAFAVELGGKFVQFLFDTAAQVVSAFSFVLQKTLDLVIDDLVAWLGYIFNWRDILMNQKVLANVFNVGLDHTVSTIANTRTAVVDAFSKVRGMLTSNQLLLDTSNALFDDKARSEPKREDPASELPQSSWGGQQMKNYSSQVKASSISLGDVSNLFHDLSDNQIQVLENAITSIQGTLAKDFDSMTWGQVISKISEIIGVTVLDSAQSCVLSFVDATTVLVRIFKVVLNARLQIPVLTYVFEKIICQSDGTQFTMLNAVTLLAAIPATVLFKALKGENLFSEAQAKAYLAASDWTGLLSAMQANHPKGHATRRVESLVISRHLGGPHALFSTWSSEAMRASVVFELVSATTRIASSICFIGAQALDQAGSLAKGLRQLFERLKAGCDWVVYVFNIVAMSCALAVSNAPSSARSVIDSVVSTISLLFRVRDTYVSIYRYNNLGKDPPAAPAMTVVQSVMGVALLAAGCVSIGLQVNEATPSGVDGIKWAGVLTTKFIASACDGLQTTLAFAALTQGQIKAVAAAVRVVLVCINALAAVSRAGIETSVAWTG